MALGNGAYERRRVAASGLVVVQHLCRTEGAVVDVVKADQTKQLAERGGLGQQLLMRNAAGTMISIMVKLYEAMSTVDKPV